MGGSESIDFLAPSGSGENTLVTCENGDYAADLEVAHAVPRAPDVPAAARRARGDRDAGRDDDRGARGAARRSTRPRRRRRCRTTKDDGTVVLALVRGDDRLEAAKLAAALEADVRPATEDEIRAAFGADPGSLGPVGFDGRDRRRRDAARRAVRRRREPHRLAPPRRRARPRLRGALRRPARAERGRPLLECGGALRFQTAIEVGHIFKLGTRYSVPLDATFLDEDGTEKPLVMGSYGIGPGRIMAAAVEQLHDENGHHLARRDRAVRRPRRRAARASRSRPRRRRACSPRPALDVLLDDRDLRAGEKFADADLIGLPMRVTVGQEDARGRHGRRARPAYRRRAACERCRVGQGGLRWQSDAKFSSEPFGTGGRAADERLGHDLPRPRREDRPLGRLPQPPRPRQPPGAVERRRRAARRRRSTSSRSTSASTACA